jgi:uncharacterized OB-fold protein
VGAFQRPRQRLHLDRGGVAPDALEIGMPVEVVFDPVTPEVTLPRFRRLPA